MRRRRGAARRALGILGGLTGALVFTLAYGGLGASPVQPLSYGKVTLASALHLPPLVVTAALAAVILRVVTLLPTERAGP